MSYIDKYEYLWTSEKNDWVLVDTKHGYAIVNRRTQFALLVEDDEMEDFLVERMKRAGNAIFDDINTAYESQSAVSLMSTEIETN